MRWKTRTALLALLPLLAFPATSRALTSAEVACEEAKLGRLLHRFATNGFGDNLFVWPVGGDSYAGLAVASPFGFPALFRDDRQLTFDLSLQSASAVLNPRRPSLPLAVLARRDPSTTEAVPGRVVGVFLELAPRVIDPTNPRQAILLSNRSDVLFRPFADVSRSLEAENLFERCSEDGPSAFDLEVFEILSRTFRISDQLKQPFPGPGLERYKAVFFRDVEPLTYRVKAWLYLTTCDPECGYGEASFQFRLRFTLDSAGKLAAGRIETLPWCYEGASPPCTESINPDVAVIVAPPIFAGHEQQPEAVFRSGAFLNVEFVGSPTNILADDIPWPELLRGTAWDRPLGVSP